MKKFTSILFIILIGFSSALAQTTKAKKKPAAKIKSADAANHKVKKPTREKFNPTADPNKDLQTAIAKAKRENKRIILDVGGEWCGWCRKMDYYFLENKALAKLRDDNFIWVKVNFSAENENKEFLAKFPPISGYPHLFVLETDGSLLSSQDTGQLEEPNLPIMIKSGESGREVVEKRVNERSYDLYKFVEFLKLWSTQ